MASRFKRQRAQQTQKPAPPPAADEDDYLSAAFTAEQPKAPGMANSDQSKRAKRLADPGLGKVLSKKEIDRKMVDRREEGLQQKIGEDNAGFKLLMKLGYKGGGLGKDGGGTTNLIAPELKQGRAGLGLESEGKRRKEEAREREKQRAARRVQLEVERRQNFRLSKAAQFEDRRLQQELTRAQRLVESLDDADGRPRSIMWPEERYSEDTVSELLGGNSRESWAADQGGASSTTLCSAAAASASDIDEATAFHEGPKLEKEGLGPDGGDREEWDMMSSQDKLSACLAYLRASHHYCMYCACKYDGMEDLQASCPGPSRDDHDDEEI